MGGKKSIFIQYLLFEAFIGNIYIKYWFIDFCSNTIK